MKKVIVILITSILVVGASIFIYRGMTEDKIYYSSTNLNAIPNKVKNKDKVILFFEQEGCPTCELVKPIINQYAKEHKNIVYSIVMNKEKDLGKESKKYNIQGTPTLLYYVNGKEVYRSQGGFTQSQFDEVIKKVGF